MSGYSRRPAPVWVCPYCLDEFDQDDRAEGAVIVTADGVVCSMCRKAGREPA